MSPSNIGSKSKSSTVHVGVERYDKLTQAAIDISSEARQQITGSHFLKFIIDNYTEHAKATFFDKLREEHRVLEVD